MKKLLHEQIRDCYRRDQLCEVIGVADDGLWTDFADKLADEIERYYIPRPRFEDGEPVGHDDHRNVQWDSVFPDENSSWRINALSDTGQPLCLDYVNGTINAVAVVEEGFVKRPQPKVLDADGVEIKVGDTVWDIEHGTWSVVNSVSMIDSDGNTICCKDNGLGHLHYKPEQLTHKEPDNLEKLRDDLVMYNSEHALYGSELEMKLDEWADRLSALIERGA